MHDLLKRPAANNKTSTEHLLPLLTMCEGCDKPANVLMPRNANWLISDLSSSHRPLGAP